MPAPAGNPGGVPEYLLPIHSQNLPKTLFSQTSSFQISNSGQVPHSEKIRAALTDAAAFQHRQDRRCDGLILTRQGPSAGGE